VKRKENFCSRCEKKRGREGKKKKRSFVFFAKNDHLERYLIRGTTSSERKSKVHPYEREEEGREERDSEGKKKS